MVGKLYCLKCPSLKKLYKSYYFLCLGEKELSTRMRFNMKQFVNIKSGTIIDSAVWRVGRDIEEVEINEENKILMDKILKKKSIKDFILYLNNINK